MIKIVNLTKDYGNGPILENVSLEINKGDSLVIIGGSGCGKSTLLRCINKLITPEKGEIYINGQNILDPSVNIDKLREKIGMVYQHFNLFSHLTILENIILAPTVVNKVDREVAIQEAKALLKKVGLSGKENQYPSSLSGGQKQRVAIARTLAMHPDVILFDEPTSALDPTMVDEVENVIKGLINEGMTSVIVTHEMSFAKNVASRVVFLAEKGIYEEGNAKEIFESPKKVLTQRFLYRSRMYEKDIDRDNVDLPSLLSEMKSYIYRYDHTKEQINILSVISDELLTPLFNDPKLEKVKVRLLCSENTSNHVIHLNFYGLDKSPLESEYLDHLNIMLIEHYTDLITRDNKQSFQITAQI